MKKYVKVKKSFATKLKTFVSKIQKKSPNQGRFIGLMQEDRKKVKEERKNYSNVDFAFEFDDVTKKVKIT